MADDTENTTENQEENQSPEPNEPEKEPFDEARARATIEAQRKAEREAKAELSATKKRLEELEKERQEREDAEKSELERAQARAEAAEKAAEDAAERVKATETRTAIILEASKLNIVDPDAAYTLLDKSEIEYDEDGKPRNVDKALKSLIESKPYLVAQKSDKSGVPESPKGSNGKSKSELIEQTKQELVATGRYQL